MKIAIAADHAGYQQVQPLIDWLQVAGHQCQNFGPPTFQPDDDYPDYIGPAAKAVASGAVERAIILGGSGQGEAIAANRHPGVRAAVYYGPAVAKKIVDGNGRVSHDPYEIVRLSRQHNDANVLSVGARFVSLQELKQVVELWLATPFSDEQRHRRRIGKIDSGRA